MYFELASHFILAADSGWLCHKVNFNKPKYNKSNRQPFYYYARHKSD